MHDKYRYTVWVLPFFLFGYQQLLAQDQWSFRKFYVEDGLSDNTISSVVQDYLGFVWVGTANGLNKFDGYSYKTYFSHPVDSSTLNSNMIEVLYEDDDHNLWIGNSEGLSLYDRRTDRFEYFQSDNRENGSAVMTICQSSDGTLWVGGWQGLSKVDMERKRIELFEPGFSALENSKVVNDIVIDHEGSIWTATTSGIDLYDFKREQFSTFSYPLDNPESESTTDLMVWDDETFWVGTKKGLYRFDKPDRKLERILPELRDETITTLYKEDNQILIGTYNGLFVYDISSNKCHRYVSDGHSSALSDNLVRSIYRSPAQDLWIGTYYGLNFTDNLTRLEYLGKSEAGTPGLKDPYVLSLLDDGEDNVWVGTANGLQLLNLSQGKAAELIATSPSLSSIQEPILSITTDNKNNIWFSTWPGQIYNYNKKRQILKPLVSRTECTLPLVLFNNDSILWIGCESGVFAYNTHTDSWKILHKELDHNIHFLYRGSKGHLWAGYTFGLLRYDTQTEEIIYFRDTGNRDKSLIVNHIYDIHADGEGKKWIGTDLGLFSLDKQGIFENVLPRHAHSNNRIMAILEDDANNLWLSSSEGLHRFNKKSHDLRRFDFSDGLQGKQFSSGAALKLCDGRMIFGGTKGLNYFFPDSIRDNPHPPKVVITNLKILNQQVPIGSKQLQAQMSVTDHIDLSYKDKEFTIEFVALNFSSPHKNQYAYKMEGFDENWTYVEGKRFASYTNLPAGEYVFKVKASNNDEIWNEEGTSVSIFIAPPFWETWWFKFIMYILIVGVVYLVYYLRTARIHQHRRELKKLVREQTKDLKIANDKIERMNAALILDNRRLRHDIQDISRDRVLMKAISFEEFKQIYPDDEACLKYLTELKWSEGFSCRKCGYKKYSAGNRLYSRRCKNCRYVETPKAFTLFNNLKFPLMKAFYIVFLLSSGKEFTTAKISELIDLRMQTCWSFKKKVLKTIKKRKYFQKSNDGWSYLVLDIEEENVVHI